MACYDSALGIDPNHAAALYNRANVLLELERPAEAVAAFDRVLAQSPSDAEALNDRGNALLELGRPDEALESYDRALALQPRYAAALYHRGMALRTLGRPAEALAGFDAALEVQPDAFEIRLARGQTLQDLKRHAEALVCFDAVLEHQPDDPDALYGRALSLHDLRRPLEALRDIDRVLAVRPPDGLAHLVRGLAMQDLERQVEAVACYDRALELMPGNPAALNNRANALRELGQVDAALADYDAVLAAEPSHAEVQFNQGICRLQTGDFARGWRQYEWRWPAGALDTPKREFSEPLWLGEPALAGRTILLHAEQGAGDTLQFCRYAPLAARRGATVCLQVQDPLLPLLRGMRDVSVFGAGDALPAFEFQCPLMSLPLAFGTTLSTIPARIPYIASDAERVARWRDVLGTTRVPRVGLVWSGSTAHKNDHKRSIPLAALASLLRVPVEFVSLQKEVRSTDASEVERIGSIREFRDELVDFAQTAALIELLDLVITVDTSVAHLAGAMGKPVWILLPKLADFRWLLGREDSPWYPTARLFRQRVAGDWAPVIARVAGELAARSHR